MLHRPLGSAARAVDALFFLLILFSSSATAAEPFDPTRGDLRFVVFGDFNGPYGSVVYPPEVARAVRAITETWHPDLLLSPGDVVAGQNRSLPDERFGEMWAAFDREVAAPLRMAGIPYAIAMGNHDASGLRDPTGGYLFARERRAAVAYWSDPMYDANLAYVDRELHPFDHAFRFGDAFVAILDASDAQLEDYQRAWLATVLDHPAARGARLRLVVGHLPLAAVARGRDGGGEVVADASELRGILESGSVDLYISGHHAAYFPGRIGDLELLFAGGVGARALLAGDAPPRSTVTVVDVWWDPLQLHYSTFDLSTMELVSPASLPPRIDTGRTAVLLSRRASPPLGAGTEAEGRH